MQNDRGPNRRAGAVGAALLAAACGCSSIASGHDGSTEVRATGAPRAVAQQGASQGASPSRDWPRPAVRALGRGERADAEAMARQRGTADPDAAALLARLAIARGQYDEAEGLLRPARAASPRSEAALALGQLLVFRGRSEDAREVLEAVSRGGGTSADALARAAEAARLLGRAHDANELFSAAVEASPSDPAVLTGRGALFLEKHDAAAAAGLFREALSHDARWAPAHLGLARSLAEENPPAAVAAARRALEIDPLLPEVPLFLAEAALDANRTTDAREWLARALALDARLPAAHALLAAVDSLDARESDAASHVAAALSVNPRYGDAFRVTAERFAARGRFEEALPYARRAVATEPASPRALADLGMHLLRQGEEAEARQVLERAFKTDAFDLVTFNLLQLLDTLDRFTTVDVGQVKLRMDPAEAPVLEPYARSIIETALERYGAKYGIAPRGPLVVEIFPKHDHFAVRTLGVPGLLGALGACFGRVVTQDSPRARPPNSFNWQATLWHELAHVFTLQLSAYRVPRWLSEGISVYEEGQVRPEWARDSELTFAEVYARGLAPRLEDFDAAFARPDLVAASYFQASVVVGLIVDRHGEQALRRLVAAYATGATTDDALRRATGGGLRDLQTALDELLERRYRTVARALDTPPGFRVPEPATVADLAALAARYPDSYRVQLAVGNALASAGARPAAFEALERAARLVPFARGASSPRARIAELARQAGDTGRARRALDSLVREDHDNTDAARQLAALCDRPEDAERRALALGRIVTADPFDAAAHVAFGRLALARRDLPTAVREFRAAVAAGPADPAAAHCDLGEALLASGRRADARREALAALEIAPTFERAQELLLKTQE